MQYCTQELFLLHGYIIPIEVRELRFSFIPILYRNSESKQEKNEKKITNRGDCTHKTRVDRYIEFRVSP